MTIDLGSDTEDKCKLSEMCPHDRRRREPQSAQRS